MLSEGSSMQQMDKLNGAFVHYIMKQLELNLMTYIDTRDTCSQHKYVMSLDLSQYMINLAIEHFPPQPAI